MELRVRGGLIDFAGGCEVDGILWAWCCHAESGGGTVDGFELTKSNVVA